MLSEGRQLQADLSSLVAELRPASTVSQVKLADLPAKVPLQFEFPSLGSGSIAISSDVQEYRVDRNCPDSISAIRTVENWYLPHGFEVIYPLSQPPISRGSLRKLRVLPWAPRLVGCQPKLWYGLRGTEDEALRSLHQEVCKCLVRAQEQNKRLLRCGDCRLRRRALCAASNSCVLGQRRRRPRPGARFRHRQLLRLLCASVWTALCEKRVRFLRGLRRFRGRPGRGARLLHAHRGVADTADCTGPGPERLLDKGQVAERRAESHAHADLQPGLH